MIIIKKIEWLSKEAEEAEVYLSDGSYNIIAFSHPFNQKVGEAISLPLYTLNVKDIYRSDKKESLIQKIGETFEYKLIGNVINKEKSHIKIGDFIIELDSILPNDISENEFVSFVCDRLDIY
ncbi:hypothetical protein N0B40_12025 [Chryseobacterium oranimense]|uniref:hypothetical protein n=1 Tax=Chryseobacterium oranimense TaxID=421058 RepID=UPI0021AF9CD3|nr:hypothetical protein [Chryseobacterium oranimense]UWX59149.1 hypothetical protein N0B40_12025 [Chryseobacterium oranimense]